MEDEVLREISNEIIDKLKDKTMYFHDLRERINNLLKSDLSEYQKEKILDLLYRFTLYKDAYVGPEVKVRRYLEFPISNILSIRDNTSFREKMDKAEKCLKEYEEAALNPIGAKKREIEDRKVFGVTEI